ncbi:MAG: DoxX family protein [Terracidiphilus sp.]
MSMRTQVEPALSQQSTLRWTLAHRVAFRFCVLYFTLFCLSNQIFSSIFPIPKVDQPDLSTLWPLRPIVIWTAQHLFRVKTQLLYPDSGSGDKTFDWVLSFCLLVIAFAGAVLWSAFDPKRPAYPTLQKWFRLFLRVALASQMIAYGLVKIVPLQMSFPNLIKQLEPFGYQSPMGILWASIGASPGYETFAGCAEFTGGLLLIFPRTVTVGALVCLADMVQVFMLNMTYDVPVKLFSFHLILLSLLLLAPESQRLLNFFLLNRAAEPSPPAPLFQSSRAKRIATAVLAFLWLWMLGNNIYGAWDGWHTYGGGRPKSPLYGIWNVDQMTVDGQLRPPLLTDNNRFRRIIFDFPDKVTFLPMDDSHVTDNVSIDSKLKTLAVTKSSDKNWKANFAFNRPAPDQLTLDGQMDGHKIHMQLRLMDNTKFLFANRGFRWIEEYPFNR